MTPRKPLPDHCLVDPRGETVLVYARSLSHVRTHLYDLGADINATDEELYDFYIQNVVEVVVGADEILDNRPTPTAPTRQPGVRYVKKGGKTTKVVSTKFATREETTTPPVRLHPKGTLLVTTLHNVPSSPTGLSLWKKV